MYTVTKELKTGRGMKNKKTSRQNPIILFGPKLTWWKWCKMKEKNNQRAKPWEILQIFNKTCISGKRDCLIYCYTNQSVIHIATAKNSLTRFYCSLLLMTISIAWQSEFFITSVTFEVTGWGRGNKSSAGKKLHKNLGIFSNTCKSSYITTFYVICHLLLFPTKACLFSTW